MKLYKNEELFAGFENGKVVIIEVRANDKVFGLYTNEAIKIGDAILAKDSLVLLRQ